MTNNQYKTERYEFLTQAFSDDSLASRVISHYGAEEIDFAEKHIRKMYETGILLSDSPTNRRKTA